MPNYIYSELTVTGEESGVQKFEEKVKEPHYQDSLDEKGYSWEESGSLLSFWNILSPPDALLEAYFNEKVSEYLPLWMSWNLENWGVRGEALDVEVTEREEGVVTYVFKTANTAPEKVFLEASRTWPELLFKVSYWDEVKEFGGEWEFSKGEKVFEEKWVQK